MVREFFLGALGSAIFFGLSLLFLSLSFKIKKEDFDFVKLSVISGIFAIFLLINYYFGNLYLYIILMLLIYPLITKYNKFSWILGFQIWAIWIMLFLILFAFISSIISITGYFN